ncbi:MAG: T9SS type A sorting domain-containing protein [Candidatus Zixiibacteriota bacterium]
MGNSWEGCPVGCLADCDISQGTADASFDLSGTLGSKYVTSTTYGRFTISDRSGSEAEVDATLDYDITWQGMWTLSGVFTGYNDCKAEVSVYLYDITDGGRVVKKTEPPVHTMTPDRFVGIDIIDIGAALDSGGTANSMNAKLSRGHTYRTALTIHITGKGVANANIVLDYFAGALGAQWTAFTVSVSPDLSERLDELEKRVDSLEAEVAGLRNDLEIHTHTYLTGRGEGHNNTEAKTSPAIIMTDTGLADSQLGWLPDDGVNRKPLPTKSLLLTNYPNPFNPTTVIRFSLPEPSATRIVVYNSLGQTVATLLDEYQSAGEHDVMFDRTDLAAGVYFYRLTTPHFVETRKMLLLK